MYGYRRAEAHRPPKLFESVQVLNGASAFLYGAAPGGSGLGGSVNLQLKRAGDTDLNRVTVSASENAHFGGSFDVARRFGQNGEWGVRLNAAYRDGETSIDREDRRTQVVGGAIDYDSGPLRAALDLAFQNVRIDALRVRCDERRHESGQRGAQLTEWPTLLVWLSL